MDSKLPPLPKKVYQMSGLGHSDDAMLAYGAECRRLALEEAAQPASEPVLHDIQQYRMQMAGISTAAFGYWKDGDEIHPDYDTLPLRDVAHLYAKYAALIAQPASEPLTNDEISTRWNRYTPMWPAGVTQRDFTRIWRLAEEHHAVAAPTVKGDKP